MNEDHGNNSNNNNNNVNCGTLYRLKFSYILIGLLRVCAGMLDKCSIGLIRIGCKEAKEGVRATTTTIKNGSGPKQGTFNKAPECYTSKRTDNSETSWLIKN